MEETPHPKGWLYRSSILIIGTAMLLGLLMMYWLNAPYHPLELHQSPAPVSPRQVKANGILFAHFDYCKSINATDRITRDLVGDKVVINLPPQVQLANTPVGCQEIDAPIVLPNVMTYGKYHIHYTIVYKVNPIREVTIEFDTEEFEIVP